jgi:hypothetical protein
MEDGPAGALAPARKRGATSVSHRTHLLEGGSDIRTEQELLGNAKAENELRPLFCSATIGGYSDMAKKGVSLIRQFDSQRELFLREALAEAKKCCPAPIKRNADDRNDQDWLEVFSLSKKEVDSDDIRAFFKLWFLDRNKPWDYQDALSQIRKWHEEYSSDVVGEVGKLIKRLRCSIRVRYTPTSAASKIAFFTKPHENVFIWDQHARRASWFRHWRRGGGDAEPPNFNDFELLENKVGKIIISGIGIHPPKFYKKSASATTFAAPSNNFIITFRIRGGQWLLPRTRRLSSAAFLTN